jgi:threonyl-tRNA synthetase
MPLWLAPEQARVLPISDKTAEYAAAVAARLKEAGLRCGLDTTSEKIGAKIAKTHSDNVPYMLIVGPKEAENNGVSVRWAGQKETVTVGVEEFVSIAKRKIDDKSRDAAF